MAKPVIFISHIHEDAQIAICVKKYIDDAFLGMFDIFVSSDGASIRSGNNWSSSIENALRKAEIVLALISPDAANRKWIFFECGGAYFADKQVIPICCRDMQISELGTPLSWLQAVDGAEETAVERLITDIAVAFDLRAPAVDASTLSQYLCGMPCEVPETRKRIFKINAQRSLPIFFIVDTSASMHGQPIVQLSQAMKQLMEELIQATSSNVAPIISIVSFGTGAKEIIPPSPLSPEKMNFQFDAGGASDLGAALHIVAKRLQNPNWLSASYYRPIIFILTDGQPTDDWRGGLSALEMTKLGKHANKISVGIGKAPDFEFLKEISGSSVVSIPDIESLQGLSRFFTWFSSSVKKSEDIDQISLHEIDKWIE